MLELIAQGPTINDRWRRSLPEIAVEMGRMTDSYRVPWDPQISRRHVRLNPLSNAVDVEVLSGASNPVFFHGQEEARFRMFPGEHFVVGGTTFLLTADQAVGTFEVPDPIRQLTFSSDFLEKVTYRDADRRISVLNRMPAVIANAGDVNELLIGMVNTLMAGITSATTIGIVCKPNAATSTLLDAATPPTESLTVIHWDRRGLDPGDFQPSEKLLSQAIEFGQSVLNVWQPDDLQDNQFTFDYENDWAFVCPISGAATSGWGIYVAGRNRPVASSLAVTVAQQPGALGSELDLDGDIKFCELVGSMLKNLLLVKQLEREQASLRSFFSPVVVDALRDQDSEQVLAPRKCDVSVLFCDLRGFSRTAETMSDDLLTLLERVSDSLGIMTRAILDGGGVIGDFHGDAVMGFWGWPLTNQEPSQNAASAVAAALAIEAEFAGDNWTKSRWKHFQFGLGIASGNAVAGKIGTRDQVKVTAFGPVVNLAARLEGMTRWLTSMILADDQTAARLQSRAGSDQPVTRRLGRFQPFGLQSELDVYQILRPFQVPAADLQRYAAASEAFEAGDWVVAARELAQLAPDDPAGRFLSSLIDHRVSPPDDFVGVIRMNTK